MFYQCAIKHFSYDLLRFNRINIGLVCFVRKDHLLYIHQRIFQRSIDKSIYHFLFTKIPINFSQIYHMLPLRKHNKYNQEMALDNIERLMVNFIEDSI
jgi:hypothetical protein